MSKGILSRHGGSEEIEEFGLPEFIDNRPEARRPENADYVSAGLLEFLDLLDRLDRQPADEIVGKVPLLHDLPEMTTRKLVIVADLLNDRRGLRGGVRQLPVALEDLATGASVAVAALVSE